MGDKSSNAVSLITDMDALCRNSIDLARYARGLVVKHIYITDDELCPWSLNCGGVAERK